MDSNEYDESPFYEEEEGDVNSPEPEEETNSNRPFMIAIGILGAVVVLAIIGMIIFVLLNRPPTSADLQNQAAQINAQNTAIALIATQTAEFESRQATQKAAPTSTPEFPTNTPVVAVASPTPTSDQAATSVAGGIDPAARTATVAAFQTQAAAAAEGTGTPMGTTAAQLTATALPETGLMDDVGLPGLVGAAAALIVVIFLARRLRYSNAQ